jgi:hypothetical protein
MSAEPIPAFGLDHKKARKSILKLFTEGLYLGK